jgi:hypothetical protein
VGTETVTPEAPQSAPTSAHGAPATQDVPWRQFFGADAPGGRGPGDNARVHPVLNSGRPADASRLFALQRTVGNAAVASLVNRGQRPQARAVPPRTYACGLSTHSGCACEAAPVQLDGGSDVDLQRQGDATPSLAGPTNGSAALNTGGGGPFTDNINISVTPVPVPVMQNALDFVNNVHAKFGGDGGETTAAMAGSLTPTEDANGNVTAATVTWNVTEKVPTVAPVPGAPITTPAAQAELTACQTLAARIHQHEDKHAANEKTGRTGFAQSLSGVNDKAVDAKLTALCVKVGTAQRALDNQEGMITLDATNAVTVSGVDHPEYLNC